MHIKSFKGFHLDKNPLLKEAVGVPTGIVQTARNIYQDLIQEMSLNPGKVFREKKIILHPNPESRYSFSDFVLREVRVEFMFEPIEGNDSELFNFWVKRDTNFNPSTQKMDYKSDDFIEIGLTIGYPLRGKPNVEKVIGLLKKDNETDVFDDGKSIVSDIVHELKHGYDFYKKPSHSPKEIALYDTLASFVNSSGGFFYVFTRDIAYRSYYVRIFESLTRPSEVYASLIEKGVTQKTFLEELKKNKTFRTLELISGFDYDKFIQKIKSEQAYGIIDQAHPEVSEGEKIDMLLKILYANVGGELHTSIQRVLGLDISDLLGDTQKIKDQKEKIKEEIFSDWKRGQSDPEGYFRKLIEQNIYLANRTKRKIAKIYSLLPDGR
jgi:hypothetical protein